MNIFVTSIGLNSGKTVVSAGVAAVMQSLGYETGVFKPIQMGCKYASDKQFAPDLNFVKKMDPNIKTYSTYNFKSNTIPAIASDNERMKFSLDSVLRDYNIAKRENDIIITEGTGGILTPVSSRFTIADIILNLKLPVIIVANVENDFLNKTLMTIKIAENYKLDICGIILNKYSPNNTENIYHEEVKLLENQTEYNILGYLPDVITEKEGINPEILISETLRNINLSAVFNMEIPKLSL